MNKNDLILERAFYIVSVLYICIFICSIDSLSIFHILVKFILSGILVYHEYKVFTKVTKKELYYITCYCYLEKFFGDIDED